MCTTKGTASHLTVTYLIRPRSACLSYSMHWLPLVVRIFRMRMTLSLVPPLLLNKRKHARVVSYVEKWSLRGCRLTQGGIWFTSLSNKLRPIASAVRPTLYLRRRETRHDDWHSYRVFAPSGGAVPHLYSRLKTPHFLGEAYVILWRRGDPSPTTCR